MKFFLNENAKALNKKSVIKIDHAFSTLGGNRTHTLLLALDFESSASTNSATKAFFELDDKSKKYFLNKIGNNDFSKNKF